MEIKRLESIVKELEEDLKAEIGAVDHMKEVCDEYEKQVESQSALIESLAVALKEIKTTSKEGISNGGDYYNWIWSKSNATISEYQTYKNNQNGK